ncbi:MAG: hypothetical protein HY260_03285 [Chloroflexi bacterium]|nr:hypothetical protein [Chloroflexota bacterium]
MNKRKVLIAVGILLGLASLCVSQVVFAPQPTASADYPLKRNPTDTPTPGPTPEPYKGCGEIRVTVRNRGIDPDTGFPNIKIVVHDDRDDDCDGVPNNHDNCPTVANHDQLKANPNVSYGAACLPESLYRISDRASEVVIYLLDGGLRFFTPTGQQLGDVTTSGGLMKIDPTLTLRQIVGKTYEVAYTAPDGAVHRTQFKYALNFGMSDISTVQVTPAVVEMKVGETRQFAATGYHASGIELWFVPRWNASGGSITPEGVYTAGGAPGDYVVTACVSQKVCGDAQVKITE